MHIQLHDDITLKEIKTVFSHFYPYLKLEFYNCPHKLFEACCEHDVLPDEVQLKTVKPEHTNGIIDIQPTEIVADLEQEFQQRFGIPAQVLWLEHGEWKQTTGMDSFSLKEVNEFSQNDSDEYIVGNYEEGFEEA